MENNRIDKDSVRAQIHELRDKEEIGMFIKKHFRAVLSYGEDKGLVPAGVFEILEINYEEGIVILKQRDGEDVKIQMPIKLLREFALMGERNSNISNLVEGDDIIADKASDNASKRVLEEGISGELIEAEVIPFSLNEILLIRNGEVSSENYSLCPILNELTMIMQMERSNQEPNNNKEEDPIINIEYELMLKDIRREQERKKMPEPLPGGERFPKKPEGPSIEM